jgi:hypothetical protein
LVFYARRYCWFKNSKGWDSGSQSVLGFKISEISEAIMEKPFVRIHPVHQWLVLPLLTILIVSARGFAEPAIDKVSREAEARRRQQRKEPHRFDWDMLQRATDSRLSPAERSRGAVACLLEEIRRPSEGNWTREVSQHHITLRNILELLGHERNRGRLDRGVIRQAARAARPGPERDVLMLLSGLTGEPDAVEYVAAYLVDVQKPAHLRVVAAQALRVLRHPRTIEALLTVAESDPVWFTESKRSIIGSSVSNFRSFVVRAAAQTTLEAFERDLLLSDAVKARLEKVATWAYFDGDPQELAEPSPKGK